MYKQHGELIFHKPLEFHKFIVNNPKGATAVSYTHLDVYKRQEHVIIPEAEENITYITMTLDENERSTQIRLMKVKDMMLEDAHHYKEKE